ncbi:transposase [Streptomyces sp. NPDC000983]|uniref:transposase n=1 Tax=Streptomyces sp. NPDC000983 TaxID=3154373 RepID=UPI003326410E
MAEPGQRRWRRPVRCRCCRARRQGCCPSRSRHPAAAEPYGAHVADAIASPGRAWWAQSTTPGSTDNSRQAKGPSGFDKTAFTIDWVNEQAVCPRGATSASWAKLNISGHTYLQARFAERDCRPCPDRARCTSSAAGSRSLAVLPRELHEIQMRNRLDQQTERWQRRYAIRANVEATLS